MSSKTNRPAILALVLTIIGFIIGAIGAATATLALAIFATTISLLGVVLAILSLRL